MSRSGSKCASEVDTESSLNSCTVDDVIVHPETERHVRIALKVEDSTTRHVGVTIPVSVCKLDVNTPQQKIGNDVVDSVGRTSDEHV